MCSMHFLRILLLLLADNLSYISSAQNHSDSVSAILQSYANSFATVEPSVLNVNKVNNPGYTYEFTTVQPQAERRIIVPVYPSAEEKESDFTSAEKNEDSFSNLSEETSDADEDPRSPPDHVIPYSVHENPETPSTRPNYTAPGEWAKPPPEKNVILEFIPTKLYAQVRGTQTVQHLPKEDAIVSAKTDEEKENAARLKEVVKVSKANTIYTEEGYEDSAYDHAGQIRDADFHEGFAKKLNDDKAKGKVPSKSKKGKARKGKSHDLDDFSEDYREHFEEVGEEARTSQQQVKPENLKVLKKAIKSPVVNAKKITEHGIFQLEEDLKRESLEAQRTSTEPYYITTQTPLIAETTYKYDKGYETTTAKREIYTIKPRRYDSAIKPKAFPSKLKIPSKYHSTYKSNPTTNVYTDSPITETPTTLNYGSQVWQYLLKHNQTPVADYNSPHTGTVTVKSVDTDPLHVASVNGHGPYLVLVTSAPNVLTPSSLESDSLESTINYHTIPFDDVTESYLNNFNDDYNINFLNQDDHRIVNDAPKYVNDKIFRDSNYINKQIFKNKEISAKSFKFPERKLFDKPQKFLIRPKYKNSDYYTIMLPPEVANKVVSRPDNIYLNNRNVLNQWSMTRGNQEPVESMHHLVQDTKQLYNEPAIKTTAVPVNRLLPPSPLSSSEYASFIIKDRNNRPIPPVILNVMPIIEAIQKHEKRQKYLPYLFRKKRSTSSTDYKNKIAEGRRKTFRHTNNATTENVPINKRSVTSTSKYPSNFENLLNESPKVAVDVVSKEIDARFKNNSNNESKETLKAQKDKNSSGEKNVEVEVPEFDFSSSFEEDETEPVTEKLVVDTKKYPFYRKSSDIKNTALEYIVNPLNTPKKTLGGMEFYDSRKLECEEIEPNLEKLVPEDKELENKRGFQKNKPRLHGLGDKVDCYKAKFFDENPLDNPLFIEEKIDNPSAPIELNPKKFASRILELPSEKDEYVIPKGPKHPEDFSPMIQRKKSKNFSPLYAPSYNNNYNYAMRLKKPESSYQHYSRNRRPPNVLINDENELKTNKTRSRPKTKKRKYKISPLYQRQVYEDVMGTIMNLDSMYKRRPKHGIKTVYKNKRIPNVYRGANSNEYNTHSLVKRKPVSIKGLVPPSHNTFHTLPYKNSQTVHANSKRNRVNSNDVPIQKLRILKRSIKEDNAVANITTFNAVNVSDKTNSSSFRIIFTTPPTEIYKRKKKTKIHKSTEQPVTQNTTYQDDKQLFDKKSVPYSIDIRRKEPKYKIHVKNKVLDNTNTSKSKHEKVKTTSPSISGSTLIPVAVKPDELFSTQVPQESRIKYKTQKLEKSKNENQYKVHENIQEKGDIKKNDGPSLDATIPKNNVHQELYDFLKGDPPGYAKTFPNENNPEEKESQESIQNEKLSDDNEDYDEDVDQLDEEESSQSPQVEETKADDKADVNTESAEGGEENSKRSSSESDSEPFVRYSTRPDSPPEYFEDEKYADLGPRINKPYFYHPPFEVPEYEKRALGKGVDYTEDDSNDDFGHYEETEDHEKYVFPWENDNDNDSQQKSTLERYEYPWERRERKKKERLEKEQLENRHSKRNIKSNHSGEDRQYTRNKKDVHNVEGNRTNKTKSKFSSKYKNKDSTESTEEVTANDDAKHIYDSDEASIASTNSDDIKESILKFIQEMEASAPKLKKSKLMHKTLTNDTYTVSSNSSLPDESDGEKLLSTKDITSLQPTNSEVTKVQRMSRDTVAPSAANVPQPHSRRRIWRNKAISNNTNTNDSTKLTNPSITQQNLNSTTSRYVRNRGRNRGTSTLAPSLATTVSPTKTVQRRRIRPTQQSVTPITTTARINSERRRRQFRTVPFANNNTNVSKITQNNSTALPPVLTSTVRTIEHHSRVSKEEIITKTIYPDEDDEEVDEDDRTEEESTRRRSRTKLVPKSKSVTRTKLRNRDWSGHTPQDEHVKTENVEKVTITMEETPDHVYKTKEVDKNGVKGKFVTITANNNSTSTEDGMSMKDDEMEEMKKKINSFNSYDGVIHDTVDEPSDVHATEKYKKENEKKLPETPVRGSNRSGTKNTAKINNESIENDDDDNGEEDSSAGESRENDRGDDETSSEESNENDKEDEERGKVNDREDEDEESKKKAIKDSHQINITKDQQ